MQKTRKKLNAGTKQRNARLAERKIYESQVRY